MRKFEIISEEQWAKDISSLDNPQCAIIDHLKPHRGTKYRRRIYVSMWS